MDLPEARLVQLLRSDVTSPYRYKKLEPCTKNLTSCERERFAQIYPYIDVEKLPNAWIALDKADSIILTENHRKIHYKAKGDQTRQPALIRATDPVPKACLIYYYEIEILNRGRNSYTAIGISCQQPQIPLQIRLPGWEKNSFGYHGDDGESYNSSNSGQPYGPTFTCGDVIGCGYNIIERTCFFTKNGHNLGIAFTDLPDIELYPTVGFRAQGEEILVNFGLEPFRYDFQNDIIALRQRINNKIINYPISYSETQATLNQLIQSWLLHNGYCDTAEVFSNAAKLDLKGSSRQIQQRLQIQKLVLSGKIGEAIVLINSLYPMVLENNRNLLFALKCRQFVEMIRDAYIDHGPKKIKNSNISNNNKQQHLLNGNSSNNGSNNTLSNNDDKSSNGKNESDDAADHINGNCETCYKMEVDNDDVGGHGSNSNESKFNETNGNNDEYEIITGDLNDSDNEWLQKLIDFGRELNLMSSTLCKQSNSSSSSSSSSSSLTQGWTFEQLKEMLDGACSLLVYSDPFQSPVAWQFDISEREAVCQQLNRAIVCHEEGTRVVPQLERVYQQLKHILRENDQIGAWLLEDI